MININSIIGQLTKLMIDHEHWVKSNLYYLDSMVFAPFCILRYLKIIFLFINHIYVVGTQKNRLDLDRTVLLST